MPLPVWPVNLPHEPWRDLFQVQQLGSAPIKSEMQSGKLRQRRQFTVNVATVPWGKEYTSAELAIFRAFISSIGDGTAEFTMPIWNAPTQTYVNRTTQIVDGLAGISEVETGPDRNKVAMVLKVQGLA